MFGYDDSLDVYGVHGIGGTWGALATGLFIAPWALPEGVSHGAQIVTQLKSIVFTAVFAPLVTIVILLVLRAIFGSLRLDEESEFLGVDLSEHSETAYMFGSASGSPASHSTLQVQGAALTSPVKAPARADTSGFAADHLARVRSFAGARDAFAGAWRPPSSCRSRAPSR
jgi:Amt family ammonium transporter